MDKHNFGKIFMRQGLPSKYFYATGYRVWRDLPHTPVTSLVKYSPWPPMPEHLMMMTCEMHSSLLLTAPFSHATRVSQPSRSQGNLYSLAVLCLQPDLAAVDIRSSNQPLESSSSSG